MPIWKAPDADELDEQILEAKTRAAVLRQQELSRLAAWTPSLPTPSYADIPPLTPNVPDMSLTTPEVPMETEQWQSPMLDVPETTQPMDYLPAPIAPALPQQQSPRIPTVDEQPVQRDTALWEKPAQVYGQVEGKVAEGISKIPVLPKVIEFAAPAFKWLSENIEKPWAAIITSPVTPDIPWQSGESWLQHQKRAYDAWEAPTYVKGAAEFSMPLWWVPWLGWATKGAKALGVGSKVARTLQVVSTPNKIVLPASDVLDTMFKKDAGRAIAWWAENKPVMNKVVELVSGKNAFIKAPFPEQTPLDITKRALGKYHIISDMRHSVNGLLTPEIQKYGNYMKLLQIDDAGRIGSVVSKDGSSTYLSDVIEGFASNPSNYRFATPQAKAFVEDTVGVLNKVYDLARREGVKVPKDFIFHRMVEGKLLSPETKSKLAQSQGITVEQLEKKLGEKVMEQSERGSLFEAQRHYKTMAEGVANGVKYINDPLRTVTATVENYVKKIATKRFDDDVKVLGKTPLEKFAEFAPDVAEKLGDLTARQTAAKYALQSVNRIFSYNGAAIPGATMKKIRDIIPDIGTKLDSVLSIKPTEVDKLISRMGREFWAEAKIKPKEFKLMLAQFNKNSGRILLGEIDDTIRSLNVSTKSATKAIEDVYKGAYLTNKSVITDGLRTIQNEVKGILESTKTDLVPLKAIRSDFLRPYRGSTGQILGKEEAFWKWHPAFRGKVFDKNVVDYAEKILADRGNEWLRSLAGVSGLSRTFVAALDFSAPFLQGLSVLGRNPVAWAKAVAKQFEFAVNPTNFYKYLASPEVAKIAADRIYYGGSRSTFEFFQALAPLQRGVGRIPKVGGVLKKGVAETYGRAEAAFTGFGEVARNEMWKALRRPGMQTQELQQLARSIDRMTGVMSTEALGVSSGQRDFESAFVFFAPRYTRAGMALVSDVFKGGLTGRQAQTTLGSMMASGMAMYIGASKALGQQPNLDLGSSRFMTLKIGDSHVGVGGIFYGMGRLAMNVLGTATGDNPVDLVRLSRFDNPFIQFMFNRTSPLTGTVVNIMEGKDYFGEPFESASDWGKFMLEKVIPISAQQALVEKSSSAPVYAASVFGARTFPKSAWELREEARDKYALDQYGQPYASLPDVNKNVIDKTPDIQMLNDEADKTTEQRGGLSAQFLARQRERDDARFMFISNLEQAQRAVDSGLMDGVEFRERLHDASYGMATTLEHIDRQPEYKSVMEKLRQPKDISNKYIGDVAYDELMQATYSNSFEDQYGIFDYTAYGNFREKLRQKYGDDVFRYVLAKEAQKKEDLPPLAQEYYKARDIMKPYWAVADKVTEMFGKTFAESSRGQSFISKQRKSLRLTNPEIAKYYLMFYSQA